MMRTRTGATKAPPVSPLDQLAQLPLRLGKLDNAAALHKAIAAEAARLLGAQRVLFVLPAEAALERIAASKLPAGESADALMQAEQRSCLVAGAVAVNAMDLTRPGFWAQHFPHALRLMTHLESQTSHPM